MKVDFIKRINFELAFNDDDFPMVMVVMMMPMFVVPVMFFDDYNLRGVRHRRHERRRDKGY
jgi:hypothetical protein